MLRNEETKSELSTQAKIDKALADYLNKAINTPVKTSDVEDLAENFDFWMKNYNHPTSTDNQHLCDWLFCENGGKFIESYAKFCELAKEVHTYGYQTIPAPTEGQFQEGMNEYNARVKRSEKIEETGSLAALFKALDNRTIKRSPEISDDELANSVFGQESHTAKRMKR